MNEQRRTSNEESLEDLVSRWLRAYGLDKKMKQIEVINAWEKLVGKAVADRTEKITINNETLHLTLKSSVIREEMILAKSDIIQRINDFAGYPMVKEVWFA